MNKNIDTKIFIERASEIHNNKYDYSLVDYKGSRIKIKIICKIHGLFEQEPSCHISKKQGCPLCAGVKKMTKDIFIKKANEIHNFSYDYSLVNYKNNKTKIDIICKEHGIFNTRPDNHINNKSGCPKCANNILYSKNDYIEKCNIIHNNMYDYSLVEYKTAHHKIKIICHKHGIFEKMPYSHMSGYGCPVCSGYSTVKLSDFIEISDIIHKSKYDYSLVKIKSNRKKVKIICPYHGVFEQIVYSHLKGHGCSSCFESKGEKQISEKLDIMNISYYRQKTFDDCKNIFKIPFDFYLPDYNICIEFDGIQHFRPIEYWGGEESFKKQIIRDQIKTDYCKNNNIKLIRIRYNEDISEKLSILK